MRARGVFGERATRRRLRSACCDESTVDLDEHVRHVADVTRRARERAARDLLSGRLRELRR